MTHDKFDALVDDATHAVNNLIPDRLLAPLGSDAHSDLLIRLNDALTPILRKLADEYEPSDPRSSTIAAFLAELIETHMLKCDKAGDHPDDCPPHIAGGTFSPGGNIDSIASCDIETGTCLYLVLEGGAAFRIVIEPVESA